MKTALKRNWLSFLLCVALIAAMALVTTGCSETEENAEENAAVEVLPVENGAELGEGETEFPLTITDLEGNETQITIHTDQTTVGEALQELGLIEGEEGQYGLYVKTVNGITADYDADKTYWGFYINGEYAMSGVDTTDIVAGDTYALAVEKG